MTAEQSRRIAEVLVEVLYVHAEIGGGAFCSCTPVADDGTREPLNVYWEQHLADALATALPDPDDVAAELTPVELGDLAAAYGWWKAHGDSEAFYDVLNDALTARLATLPDPEQHSELDAALSDRDEQERLVMQVSASADEWWGLYDQELRARMAAEAATATVVTELRDWATALMDADRFLQNGQLAMVGSSAVGRDLLAYCDRLGALPDPEQETDAGRANDCRHTSATGIDTSDGPEKVWACDHCELRWRQDGLPLDPIAADLIEQAVREVWAKVARVEALFVNAPYVAVADLRAALMTVRTGTLGDHEICRRCGGENVNWFAPSPLWNLVMRGNDINGDALFHDLVCMGCFVVLAKEAGVKGHWRLTVDPEPDGLIYVTPTGRVWNAERDLWDPA